MEVQKRPIRLYRILYARIQECEFVTGIINCSYNMSGRYFFVKKSRIQMGMPGINKLLVLF